MLPENDHMRRALRCNRFRSLDVPWMAMTDIDAYACCQVAFVAWPPRGAVSGYLLLGESTFAPRTRSVSSLHLVGLIGLLTIPVGPVRRENQLLICDLFVSAQTRPERCHQGTNGRKPERLAISVRKKLGGLQEFEPTRSLVSQVVNL